MYCGINLVYRQSYVCFITECRKVQTTFTQLNATQCAHHNASSSTIENIYHFIHTSLGIYLYKAKQNLFIPEKDDSNLKAK